MITQVLSHLPPKILEHLPKTASGVRALDASLQEKTVYGSNCIASLIGIMVALVQNKFDWSKALLPSMQIGFYELANILVQWSSWNIGAKALQPFIVKKLKVDAGQKEAVSGIVGKVISLIFWVGVFPFLNSYFDDLIQKIYSKITGKKLKKKVENNTNTQDSPPKWFYPALALGAVGGLTAIGLGSKILFSKQVFKNIDMKKCNQLLLDLEPFLFIPLTWFVFFLTKLKNGWTNALEDSKQFGIYQSINFASQALVVLSKGKIAKSLINMEFKNNENLNGFIQAAKQEPTSLQNMAFCIINGIKDIIFPIISGILSFLLIKPSNNDAVKQ